MLLKYFLAKNRGEGVKKPIAQRENDRGMFLHRAQWCSDAGSWVIYANIVRMFLTVKSGYFTSQLLEVFFDSIY